MDGELVGFGLVGGFAGRAPGGRCFYTGDARVLPGWRERGVIQEVVTEGIAGIWPDTHEGFGIVKVGNAAGEAMARSVCARAGVPGVAAGALEVALLPVLQRWPVPDGVRVRAASAEDAPLVASLLREHLAGRPFAPVPDPDEVAAWFARPGLAPERWWGADEGGRPAGVLGSWDLTPFRAARVLRYSTTGKLLRGAQAAASRLLHEVVPLPRSGGHLRLLSTTRVAATSPAVLRGLLAAAMDRAHREGFHALGVVFVGEDPLRPALRGLLRQSVRSTVFRFRRGERPPSGERPYVDLAMI